LTEMTKRDPWTDPDPQPGDFDEMIRESTPDEWEHHEGNPDARVLRVTDEEAERMMGIGLKPDEDPKEVAAEILRRARARQDAG
jgi:hypothetical protein